jgi:hypothetical protein
MSTPAVAPPTGEPLSEGARLINTFVAPSKTFRDILRKTNWWVPFLITIAFVGVMQFFVIQAVGPERLVENQFAKMPKVMDRIEQGGPQARDQFMEKQAANTKRSWITAPIFPGVIMLVTGLLLWGTFSFGAGQRVTFGQSMAVVSYASLPGVIKSLLVILVAYLSPDGYNPLNPIGTNLGYYIGSLGSSFFTVFLSMVDVFTIWTLFLTALGFTQITKAKMGVSSAIVIGWFLVFALGFSGLLSMFVG